MDVPYVRQFNEHSCLIACAAMVLRYYGARMNQRRVYKKAVAHDPLNKRRIMGCWEATLILAIRKKGFVLDNWIDWRQYAGLPRSMKVFLKSYRPILAKAKRLGLIRMHRHADIKLIKRLVDKGVPVIAEVHTNTLYGNTDANPSETHTVVITGFENQHFVYNDPYNYGKKGLGLKISLRWFKTSWEAPPYYKNSMMVFKPKSTR